MNSVFSAQVEKLETRADQTLKVSLGTQELDAESEQALFKLRKTGLVKVLISSTNISEAKSLEVDSVQLEAPKGKSPSKRLRAVLYRVWESNAGSMMFDDWYDYEMERIIEHYKTKLDEE